ncbi:DEAD/DEAH box helicase [Pseudomonas sp.]|uniref:SNF2-related protein n=1 Tax=Pseudomonas sp. TaxID=306 RepID=UPI0025891F7B|nr:DEAD/DEAH box helicase [Pseudomonas sp.]
MQVHMESKSLVLKLRDPARVTEYIPKARVVPVDGVNFTQVRFGLDEARVLRNLGIKAPSPIRYFYDWPLRIPGVPQAKPFEHQVTTAEFFTLNQRGICLNDMGCVDATTEYLSPTGWQRIDQYTGGMVAQYVPETGAVEFVAPTEYVKKPCPEMIRFKTTKGVDQLLSPEHRVLYVGSTGKTAVRQAWEVEARHEAAAYGWKGRFITTFSADAALPGMDISDAALRLQVAVQADGHFSSRTNRVVVRLKKQRKIDRMTALLAAAGVEAKTRVQESTGFTIFSFDAPIRLKTYDTRYWACNAHQLAVIASECSHWDGSQLSSGGSTFYSTNKCDADFIQYAFAASGRTASVRVDEHEGEKPLYAVHARDHAALLYLCGTNSGVKSNTVWREPSPDGFKYCFMVPSTFLLLRRNGCIFATGNTGKTLSATWAADYLMQQRIVNKCLIACTRSTMHSAWGNEVKAHFFGRRKAVVLQGSKARRLKLLEEDADFYIINHDGLKVIQAELAQRTDINLWVLDEAAEFKNAQSDRHKTFAKLVRQTDWMWMLTGTPCSKDPTDVWGLAKLLGSKKIPHYFSAFKNDLMQQITQYKWVPKPGAFEKAYEVLSPSIRFKKSDCLDLPPVTFSMLMADMSAEQKKAYETMRQNLVVDVKGVEITAAHAATKMLKLLQISLGAVYDEYGEGYMLDASPRLQVVDELIEESSRNVIVFVPFTKCLDLVANHIRSKGYTVDTVDGRVGDTARKKIFDDFQNDPGRRVLVAHPKTAAHGLTLTRADLTIWYGPIMDLGIFEQANNRMDRPGQKHAMTVACIAANALELELYSALKNKQTMQNTILAMFKNELGLPNA